MAVDFRRGSSQVLSLSASVQKAPDPAKLRGHRKIVFSCSENHIKSHEVVFSLRKRVDYTNSTSITLPKMFSRCSDFAQGSILLCVAVFLRTCGAVSSLKIDTTVGTVYGLINGTHPDVAQFLGIPFAEPPVGDLRWEPSIAKYPVEAIDATSFSPSCPQYDTSIPSVYEIDAREFLISGLTSEDCLTLSIWAPYVPKSNCAEKLPVLVWIYGGGQVTGGAQIEYQIPTPWVQRSQAHIVVQIK